MTPSPNGEAQLSKMSPDRPDRTLPPAESPGDERLDSWKEIAAYLKREVRTLHRWEAHEGLPIRRHLHRERGSVYAYNRSWIPGGTIGERRWSDRPPSSNRRTNQPWSNAGFGAYRSSRCFCRELCIWRGRDLAA
jgi:hypothetical protein